jgi:hypothetical protein
MENKMKLENGWNGVPSQEHNPRLNRRATTHLLRVVGRQTYMMPAMERVNDEVQRRGGASIVDIHNTDRDGPALGLATSFYVYLMLGIPERLAFPPLRTLSSRRSW